MYVKLNIFFIESLYFSFKKLPVPPFESEFSFYNCQSNCLEEEINTYSTLLIIDPNYPASLNCKKIK